jgi:hypothetical protein
MTAKLQELVKTKSFHLPVCKGVTRVVIKMHENLRIADRHIDSPLFPILSIGGVVYSYGFPHLGRHIRKASAIHIPPSATLEPVKYPCLSFSSAVQVLLPLHHQVNSYDHMIAAMKLTIYLLAVLTGLLASIEATPLPLDINAKDLKQCGSQWYDTSSYTCSVGVDNVLCPVVNGVPMENCGGGCYTPLRYRSVEL